jgi:hypothetical protein
LRRNCFLKHVIEGKTEGRIEVTGRRGRRRKQVLYDLKEKREYWKLKEEERLWGQIDLLFKGHRGFFLGDEEA